jgi:hypothetical protein
MKLETLLKRLILKPEEEHPLSRLFGYEVINGKGQIKESEAEIIALVINNIAVRSSNTLTEIIDDLLNQFDQESIRNRSGKKWTASTLLGLVRPIYAGVFVNQFGTWKRSKIYPPIVSIDRIKQALKRIKSEKTYK